MRKFLAIALAAALVLPGCVEVDGSLGEGLVDKSLLYDTYTVEFPITDIQLKMAEDLSGYSSSRLTLGAIRDEKLGLTTREAAFSLVPALDTIDLGTNPAPVSFTLYFEADTVSCNKDSEASILQNLRVTELTAALPDAFSAGCTQEIPHGSTLITKGIPVYSGGESLSFTFTNAYAQKYIDALRSIGPILKQRPEEEGGSEEGLIDKYDEWVAALPGIHLAMDAPEGNGGRINLFNFSCMSVSSGYYYRNNNIGALKVHSTWEGVEKDSTFLFIPGEPALYDEVTYQSKNTLFDQYCFNRTTHSLAPGAATDEILVEGGGGLKPVISARELQEKTAAAIVADGRDPAKAIIVKASVILPFEKPAAGWDELKYFPTILSPTIRMEGTTDDGKDYVTFAGLTDASVSTENQGSLDRSNLRYAPDITYHLQALMDRTDLDTATDADIWLLTIYTEKTANASGSLYDNDYYQQLLYASYYNSIYGGGYGYGGYGYGSYGYGGYGYNDYYSNYYNYMMLEQMMYSSTQTSYSYSTTLDKDRFYRGVLHGPGAASDAPLFRVTYAVPRD